MNIRETIINIISAYCIVVSYHLNLKYYLDDMTHHSEWPSQVWVQSRNDASSSLGMVQYFVQERQNNNRFIIFSRPSTSIAFINRPITTLK